MRRLLLVLPLLAALHADAAISKADLQRSFEEALAAAEEVPAEKRRELAYALDLEEGTPEERIRMILFKLALRPSSPVWFDFAVSLDGADRLVALDFLEGVYRTRAGVNSDAARDWQQGLAEMLFCTGRFDEALRLQRQVVARGGASSYGTILLAVMEKVAGDGESFARLQADPPPPLPPATSGQAYFRSVVTSVARRMMRMLRSETPAAIRQMLVDVPDWKEKMQALEMLRRGDPAAARAQLEAVLADPAAPDWAKDDAVYGLARLPRRINTEPGAVIALVDCWAARRGVTMPVATAETWARLAALPEDPKLEEWVRDGWGPCYRYAHPAQPPSEDCLLNMATLRIMAALNADDFAAMQQGIEWLAALVLETERGLSGLGVWLSSAGNMAPQPLQRDRIHQYAATLSAQKLMQVVNGEEVTAAVRRQTGRRVASPWDTLAPRAENARCP